VLTSTWVSVAVIVASLLAMLTLVEALRRRFAFHPEITRKSAHVGLGLATLSFPFLFDSTGPVVIVGLVVIASLAAIRWVPALAIHAGKIVHGVERRSSGDLYFPIAAIVLFAVTSGDPVLFGIPILTLALADAAAAVVGVRYGRIRFGTGEGSKSLEGSIAFFAVAFLTTHLPLLLFTDTGRLESVIIGIMVAILVMLLEAVSLRGTDNLLIPFGGYLLLAGFLDRGVAELAAALVVTVLLLVLVLTLRKRRTLSDTAVLAAALFGFASWSVGGWRWLVPPIALFLSYTVLWPRRRLVRRRPHDLLAVTAVASSALVWMVLAFVLDRPDLYYPYTISIAATLCFAGIAWFRIARPRMHPATRVVRSAAVAWMTIFPLFALAAEIRAGVLLLSAGGALCLVAAGLAFDVAVPAQPRASRGSHPWVRHVALCVAASVLGLVLLPWEVGLR
jgi:phytol kinase